MSPTDDRRVGRYLDDCAFDYDLVAALEIAGLRAVTPIDAGLLGARDEEHLAFAAAAGLPLLTKNPRDFAPPRGASGTAAAPEHAGILAVYQDNDPARDMSPADIARAVCNLLATGLPVAGHVHVLNQWQY